MLADQLIDMVVDAVLAIRKPNEPIDLFMACPGPQLLTWPQLPMHEALAEIADILADSRPNEHNNQAKP